MLAPRPLRWISPGRYLGHNNPHFSATLDIGREDHARTGNYEELGRTIGADAGKCLASVSPTVRHDIRRRRSQVEIPPGSLAGQLYLPEYSNIGLVSFIVPKLVQEALRISG
jgi:hypothetical protein